MNEEKCAPRYNIIPQSYTQAKRVIVDRRCNSWTAWNNGDDTVFVNNVPLLPRPAPGLTGESLEISGNEGEVYGGDINIAFAGTGTNPSVFIFQKVYI